MKRKKKPKPEESAGLIDTPEIMFDRMIMVKAPSNFAELVAENPTGPEIQNFLNAALAAANLAREPTPRRPRASKRKTTKPTVRKSRARPR